MITPNSKDMNSGHLTYCTNIHAGEYWKDHFEALKQNFPEIKSHVSPAQPMGIGLRLSNLASIDLIREENLTEFRKWLDENQAYVFTMNGFPYGEFHHTRVKDQVHAPDWTSKQRVDYTLRLFQILKKLLPANMEGGISTSPLSYKHWFGSTEELAKAKDLATENILLIAEELIHVRQSAGIFMHLDIEPEPDGLLETGEEFIAWFEDHLLVRGRKYISEKLNISVAEAEKHLKEHVNLCYDVCHFAIGYEPHDDVIKTLTKKGIKVGKVQISAALKAALPENSIARLPVKDAFSRFNEPTYLHQVVARMKNGELLRYPDLPEALSDAENLQVIEWRAHFHVPIFMEDFGLVRSTQSDIIQVLKIQNEMGFTNHLEVETYTWEVLPETLKLPLNQSIIRELEWVKQRLAVSI